MSHLLKKLASGALVVLTDGVGVAQAESYAKLAQMGYKLGKLTT